MSEVQQLTPTSSSSVNITINNNSSSSNNKMAMGLQQNIEVLRCLYHLDLFRRSIRKIRSGHVNAVRELFNTLTVLMSDYSSENSVNPAMINTLIGNHLVDVGWSGCRDDLIYERLCKEMSEDNRLIVTHNQIQPQLSYNLTKVCTKCGSSTPLNGCLKNQFVISVEPIEASTFEDQIIASLDSNEFCEQSNCFGHQRTYRSLSKQPNIFTFDYKSTPTKVFNLHEYLNPAIIFESPSDNLYRLTAITLSPASSLVYHSRLNIWLFITNSQIKPLSSNLSNFKYSFNNYSVQMVFYTLDHSHTDSSNAIYENWTTTTTTTNVPGQTKVQNSSSNSNNSSSCLKSPTNSETEAEYYDSGISSYNSSIETSGENQVNPQEPIPKPNGNHLSNYATIKRNRSKSKNIIKSISVPNLAVPMEHLVKRKVSFNCDIELIDLNEEYNPHPILMKILEKMKI